MIPRVAAPRRARYFAATPLAPPVRNWPSVFASSTPTQSPDAISKITTTNTAWVPVALYVLIPAYPIPWSLAPISARCPPPIGRRTRGWLVTSPAANRRKESSTIGTASAGAINAAVSLSVR